MAEPKVLKTAFSSFTLGKSIGDGGNGHVYKASSGDEEYAIKILHKDKIGNRDKRKRFKNEWKFCSELKHDNIIRTGEYGLTSDECPFFVMPLYSGSIRKLVGKMNEDECYSVVLKIIDGMEAYQKYDAKHRDIKPENILCSDDQSEIVITDFGIALFATEDLYTDVKTKPGAHMANRHYAAPEQGVRDVVITKATDIYSLGMIINDMFTGQRPIGTNPKQI